MAHPDGTQPRPRGWRVLVLAILFALLSHGCFIVATSLTRSPF
jgi:hypothetical protein